jgi:hypothetical protein
VVACGIAGYGDGVDGAPNGVNRAKKVVVEHPSDGEPSMGKSIGNFAAVTRVGLDLAKKVFQAHAIDAEGEIVVARQAPGSRLRAVAGRRPPHRHNRRRHNQKCGGAGPR